MDKPDKKSVAKALLLRNNSFFIHLDPRREGVILPEWLMAQPQVVLQVGINMPVPIPDLRINSKGIHGTLSFKGIPFCCSVPWDAIFALIGDDSRGMVWNEALPAEINRQIESATSAERGASPNVVSINSARNRKTVVRKNPKKEKPSYLRLVK